jgi:hypothetical protein
VGLGETLEGDIIALDFKGRDESFLGCGRRRNKPQESQADPKDALNSPVSFTHDLPSMIIPELYHNSGPRNGDLFLQLGTGVRSFFSL